MYDRILVPTDRGLVDPALVTAIELAKTHGAELLGLHVLQTDHVAGMPLETTWVGVTEVARDEAEAAVAGVREEAEAAGVPVETSIREGNPSREIVRCATEEECDLIVMSTSGRVGLDRFLLGSVTERVVRRAPVPVLTIRRTSEAEPEVDSTESDVGT